LSWDRDLVVAKLDTPAFFITFWIGFFLVDESGTRKEFCIVMNSIQVELSSRWIRFFDVIVGMQQGSYYSSSCSLAAILGLS
jgi:hypothetical protein